MITQKQANYMRANQIMRELEEIRPLAFQTNQLETWCAFYTEAFIMKLRCMP